MAKPAAASRRGSFVWLQGLACGALVMLAQPTALLGIVLLVPAILIATFDRADRKPVARAVLLYGAAGATLPMMSLWTGGNNLDQSIALLGDTTVIARAWSAQAGGWLLTQLAPLLVRVLMEAHASAEGMRLRSRRAALEAEWTGIDPSPHAKP